MKKEYIALNHKVGGVKKGDNFHVRPAIGKVLVAIGAAKPVDDGYETRDQPALNTKKVGPKKEEQKKEPPKVTPPKEPGVNATDGAIAEAKIHNIDLSTVQGTGENGRIVKNDITALLENENTGS